MSDKTDMTEEELKREVEAQALADRVWEILEKRVHAQLEGVIALEPQILHPHLDWWFAVRTNNDPSKVSHNPLNDVLADTLSSNWRMQQWFKQQFKQQLQEAANRMNF
jgi:hypothetical protein